MQPEICLIMMEMIGGKEALKFRIISKSWLAASQHFRSINLQYFSDVHDNLFKITDHILMEHVSDLEIFDNKLTVVESFRRFVENPHLRNLKTLYLEYQESMEELFDGDFTDPANRLVNEIGLIANCEIFAKLENLTIINHKFTNRGLSDIFNSKVLRNLKTLNLQSNSFTNFGSVSSGTNCLINLTALILKWELVTLEDIQLMCNNQLFSKLKKLVIAPFLNSILKNWDEGFSIILNNPVWSNLKYLKIELPKILNSVSNIKCTLQLEKLIIRASSDLESCKSLILNKSISLSLKYLDIGKINSASYDNTADIKELDAFRPLFETFIFKI
ncbi:predicted protein [Naegleria gruberi]|uniref:Predicted protein n=1 Tax=Naegleria gruberi TaxID=5762 RepID=D2V6N8_NAEGR|nr:uncharacterized protein NAEGRDRAFT_64507 [Naegleria gruberi]EFC47610.1 predicted protein [Naegleria gruberi]|eukprot:XP_002680354.1 predicted protein [Naegleria gruberi strain NEG-M]